MILFNSKKRLLNSIIVLISGIIIFILGLGTTGLVDETPPLFASADIFANKVVNWLNKVMHGYK